MKENILTLLTTKANVAYINSNATLRQGIEKFKVHGYTAVPILNEDGTYFGVITEGDFLWKIINSNLFNTKKLEEIRIKDIVRKEVPACKIDATIEELSKLISQYNFVPIVDDRNILMGIITRKAVITHLNEKVKKIQ